MRHFLNICGLLLATCLCQQVGAEDLAIVANVPSGAALNPGYAVTLLRGDNQNWDGGTDARVVLPSRESPIYAKVAEVIFGTTGKRMQRTWFRLVFSGRVNAPTYLGSDREVVEFVRRYPGAIGVIALPSTRPDGISLIRLNRHGGADAIAHH